MRDVVTDAIVLGITHSKNYDRSVSLFTKDLGRIKARVSAGSKILSKFSPHIDPLNHVMIRLTYKKGFTLTDALTTDRFYRIRGSTEAFSHALRAIALVEAMSPLHEPDARVWNELNDMFRNGNVSTHAILRHFGYDAMHAECDACGRAPKYFIAGNHTFLCAHCAPRERVNAISLQ